jgi:hypothetical protein
MSEAVRNPMKNPSLILLELNEVNFEIVKCYIEQLGLNNFSLLFEHGIRRTTSEQQYEQLEPWIQWVSAHSGLTAEEHGIYRLGDIVDSDVPQFFEKVEAAGYSVGAVSPMNTKNRLRAPAYFIPDPWTNTPTDGSFWSRHLWRALSQIVNDNARSRITFCSALTLALALLRFARPRNYGLYFELLLKSKGAPWRKALFLDLFLHDFHMRLYQRRKPHFSTLFLNAGAHIQHHYFFNSKHAPDTHQSNPAWYISAKDDPIAEMLAVYDTILGEYLNMKDTGFMVATGLTQIPYDHLKFYYRLKDHDGFLRRVGIKFVRVLPRMTRDFTIEFESVSDCIAGQALLGRLHISSDQMRIFGEIDNRGTSLFVTLTYPNEISADACLKGGDSINFNFAPHVAFVAIKNGMHANYGFVTGNSIATEVLPKDGEHIKYLHASVLRFFKLIPGLVIPKSLH